MPIVRVVGWKPGMRKISLTKLVQANAGKDLGKAKAMVDALLEGQPFDVSFDNEEAARSFSDQASALGARPERADGAVGR